MSRKLFVPLGLSSSGYLLKCDPYTLIAAGMNVAGNIATNQINAERATSDMATYLNLVKRQREWQLADYESNQERTKDLMDYERDYNTPKEQMQRLKDAGLNPYLASHEGNIGTGNGSSAPTPSLPSRGSVSPMQRPPLDNVFNSPIDKIMQGASIRNQRIASFAEMAKSIPSLVKGIGKDSAKRLLESIYGQSIDNSLIADVVMNEALSQEYQTSIDKVEAKIAETYGIKKASNFVALQEQEFNKMAAEIGKMASDAKVNESMIHKLASDYVRNLADAFKLRKEGEKYVADANFVNQMREMARLQTTRLSFENRSQGYFDGSDVDWYLRGNDYQRNQAEKMRIWSNRESDDIYTAIDHALSNWISIGAGAYSGFNTNYNVKSPVNVPKVSGFGH